MIIYCLRSLLIKMDKLFDSLTYFGLFQGLFLLTILIFGKQYRKQINGYLVFLIIVIVIGLLGRALLLLEIFGYEPRLMTISEFSILLFGPAFALFVRSSLKHLPFKKQDLLHFIPACLHIIYLIKYFILASDETLNSRYASGELIKIVLILGTIGLIVNIGYWVWSWMLLTNFKTKIVNELSYSIKSRFLTMFLIAIGICLAFWFTIILITFFEYELMARVIYNFVWISLTIIILFVGFHSFTQPELFNIEFGSAKTKYTQSKLKHEDIQSLKEVLEQLMQTKKPYLNKKLLKTELAELLGVNNPEMARLLNEGIGMNFFEFVNYYRIKEFIELVESKKFKNFTFMAIASEAGFNSKSTFNKAFKDIMGKTPRQYFA